MSDRIRVIVDMPAGSSGILAMRAVRHVLDNPADQGAGPRLVSFEDGSEVSVFPTKTGVKAVEHD